DRFRWPAGRCRCGPSAACATARIHAQDADIASVTAPVSLEDLDGGGLAGSVRAEQREHLAFPNRQVNPADGLRAGVGLDQPPDIDRQDAFRVRLRNWASGARALVLCIATVRPV